MTRADILLEIKKAETEADAKVKKTEADKKNAIIEARRDSVKRIQDAELEIRNTYEFVIAQEQKILDDEREKLLAIGINQSNSIEKSSEEKIKEVNDFLTKEFERATNVIS